MADELFDQTDANKDQQLDFNEFRHLIAQNLGASASDAIYTGGDLNQGPFSTSTYESSSTGTYGGFGGTTSGTGEYDFHTGSNTNLAAAGGTASSSTYETNTSEAAAQQYATNAQGLFQDPNPQVIRRPAQSGQLTYTQNIKIRFLQPPAVPPPGPLIIKEVRPPQPPPPPPLIIRQRAPALPQPPPLVLREKPPAIPATVGAQTVIRKLPPIPVPPRSVIIERLPPLPPKPRDIIIERWIPYSAITQRKTIVQRAEAVKPYPKPRNIIIQYEAPQVRVIRQFERLGVTPENPQAYIQRYGASLIDAQTLVQQARAAGVIEDISPPTNFTSVSAASASSTFESSNTYLPQPAATSSYSGYESIHNGSNAGFSGPYDSNAFLTQGDLAGYSGYNSTSGSNIDIANAAFNAADLNKDGSIDPNEFRQFLAGGN